jgi:hypothetical protein
MSKIIRMIFFVFGLLYMASLHFFLRPFIAPKNHPYCSIIRWNAKNKTELNADYFTVGTSL